MKPIVQPRLFSIPGVSFNKSLSQVLGLTFAYKYSHLKPMIGLMG